MVFNKLHRHMAFVPDFKGRVLAHAGKDLMYCRDFDIAVNSSKAK